MCVCWLQQQIRLLSFDKVYTTSLIVKRRYISLIVFIRVDLEQYWKEYGCHGEKESMLCLYVCVCAVLVLSSVSFDINRPSFSIYTPLENAVLIRVRSILLSVHQAIHAIQSWIYLILFFIENSTLFAGAAAATVPAELQSTWWICGFEIYT